MKARNHLSDMTTYTALVDVTSYTALMDGLCREETLQEAKKTIA